MINTVETTKKYLIRFDYTAKSSWTRFIDFNDENTM